jgi:hypothetical protein
MGEKLPMTLQVAFSGKDGFVLASDKKASSTERFRQIPGVTPTRTPVGKGFKFSKIVIYPSASIVCLFSGSDDAAALAESIAKNAPADFASNREVSDYLMTCPRKTQPVGTGVLS